MRFSAATLFSFAVMVLIAHVETHATQVAASAQQSQSFTTNESKIRIASSIGNSGFMSPTIVSIDRKISATPQAAAPKPAPAVAASKPITPSVAVTPTEPSKPAYPRCSSKLADVKAMMHDTLHVDMLDRVWIEDAPKFGGRSRIKVYSTDPLIVEMFGGDGESIGTTKVTACVNGGKLTAHIRMAGLNFGAFAGPALKAQLAVAQNGNTSELIMDISAAANGKVRIADRMTMFQQRIDSTFSASAAAR
jgi:hypothetical protein